MLIGGPGGSSIFFELYNPQQTAWLQNPFDFAQHDHVGALLYQFMENVGHETNIYCPAAQRQPEQIGNFGNDIGDTGSQDFINELGDSILPQINGKYPSLIANGSCGCQGIVATATAGIKKNHIFFETEFFEKPFLVNKIKTIYAYGNALLL